MNTKTIALIFIIGIIILGGAVLFASNKSQNQNLGNNQNPAQEKNKVPVLPSMPQEKFSITVDIENSGFTPQTLTVKKGATIQIKNSTSSSVEISSDKSSFVIAVGKTYSLSFPKPGQYQYMNKAIKNQSLLIIIE